MRKDLCRSSRSTVPRCAKDVESDASQKFVELPRTTSPFYNLPDYTDDDQEDTVLAISGQQPMLDHKNGSGTAPAAPG